MVKKLNQSQSSLFLDGEADAWFLRNQESISVGTESFDVSYLCSTLNAYQDKISNILEIGCGGGAKLIALSNHFNAVGDGIDPSGNAIQSAKEYTATSDIELNFSTGLATNLPFEDNKFDLVFFGFCLYLVPPNEIYKAVAEADRVLRSGGFLAILDFDYGQMAVNPYKHAPGIFSYKNNYSQLFTSSGYFHQVSKWSYSHTSNTFTPDRDERISIEVLYKEVI